MSTSHSAALDALADGIARAAADAPGAFLLPLWSALVRGTAAFADFGDAVRARRQLTYLTIDTTGACDLKCTGMCYYHPEISLKRPTAPHEALAQAIREASSALSMRVLAFAGKEPLLNARRLFALIDEASAIPDRPFAIGIVTNGRHVLARADALLAAAESGGLDYVDVSIDSADAAAHDEFRGVAGTHERAVAAVRWLNNNLPALRTTVVSVLRGNNHPGVLDLIRDLSDLNTHFQIQPIQPPPYSTIEQLRPEAIVQFIRDLCDLMSDSLEDRAIEVSVELSGIYLLEVVRAGVFSWADLREDENATVYVERRLGANTLVITCELFPLQAWRLARIMYSGAYLAHMHFLQAGDPHEYAIGYVEQESISTLFDRAMEPSSHFGQVLASRVGHACARRPCWSNCFGGWNGAENALLEKGRKLSDQPRLCKKVHDDFIKMEADANHAPFLQVRP